MGQWMDGYLTRLEQLRQENLAGGGPNRLQTQQSLGKLSARERIGLLADPNTFEELGSLVRDGRTPIDGRDRPSPGDGVVMGFADVRGRPAAVYAFDFTVLSGALGDQAVWKLNDLTKIAGQMGVPLIGMIDSAGERLSLKGGDSGSERVSASCSRNTCRSTRDHPPHRPAARALAPGRMARSARALTDFLIIRIERRPFSGWAGKKGTAEARNAAEFHMERSGQCDLITPDRRGRRGLSN